MPTDAENGDSSAEQPLLSYGTNRHDAPRAAPEYEHLLPAFRQFVDGVQHAAYVFENEDDVEGCKIALHAVMRLLGQRHLPFWTVFSEMHGAFNDLGRGVDPELFSRTREPRPRSRSSRRRHAQLLAAVCLGWRMERGESLEQAARTVARHVAKWSEFSASTVTHETIRNWRDAVLKDERGDNYHRVLAEMGKDPDAAKRIEDLLRSGPPASPHPRNGP
jgi:hypothetical protein